MGAQFRCENENRRLLIRAPPSGATLNGIDHLEVLDADAPPGTPRQQTLLVRLFGAASGLDAGNVAISGGVRETDVGAVWAQPADAISVPGENAAFYGALPQADRVLVVRTDKAGDFSTYRLSLVGSPSDPAPPAGFDPVLSRIDFSFKVQCPSPFDCAPAKECPPRRVGEPLLDYLAKDAASFRRVLFDRLANVIPHWRQRSPADAGVAVVEAIAYVADHLSYQQDAVATEAYLDTARRRISVRRHARLLDYRMHEGTNSRAWVCVEVSDEEVVLRKKVGATRTIFFTRSAASHKVSPEVARDLIREVRPQVFEPMTEVPLYGAHNRIELYTWGDDRCCLPAGATRATLRDRLDARLRLAPDDVLILEEALGKDSGQAPDADPTRRHAVRLTAVNPPAAVALPALTRTPGPVFLDPINDQPIVEIEWHADDALPFPMCVSKVIGGSLVEDITVARGNVILVDHGQTQSEEPLAPASVPERGRYRPRLARRDVTHAAPVEPTAAAGGQAVFSWPSAAATVAQDPRRAVPSVSLRSPDGTPWTAQPDLLGSDRFATDFVVEMEDTGEAFLRFGDGILGREPEDGLVASYRTGRGRAGNVGAEVIAHLVHEGITATRVRNPLPAVGGVDPETIREVKLYAPQAFRTQDRAVTEADYAASAERHPEVQKAVATRRWTGSWYTIFVAVDRRGGRPVDAAFQAVLLAFLERFRLSGHDLEIDPPRLVPLDLRLVVCVKPGYLRDTVRRALLETFAAADQLGGRRGFFHPDNFTFGQPVYLSDVVSEAMRVPGVDWVDPTDPRFVFQRFARPAGDEIATGRISMARLEIARLDNSPSFPENGRLELVLMGGR